MADLKIPTINKITISGRITKDMELKTLPSGKSVCSFTVANERRFKNAQGEFETETLFIACQAWAYVAESLCKSAHKGSPVIIDGRLSTRKWTNRDGVEQTTWEVVAEQAHILEWPEKDTQTEVY